jgi:hypothetical protein
MPFIQLEWPSDLHYSARAVVLSLSLSLSLLAPGPNGEPAVRAVVDVMIDLRRAHDKYFYVSSYLKTICIFNSSCGRK